MTFNGNGKETKIEMIEIDEEMVEALKKFFIRKAKLSRHYIKRNDKSYVSYRINLPKDLVEMLSYSKCEEVSVEAAMTEDGEIVIIIRKCNPQQSSQTSQF